MTDGEFGDEFDDTDAMQEISKLMGFDSPDCPLCGQALIIERHFHFENIPDVGETGYFVNITHTCPTCGDVGACNRLVMPSDFADNEAA